MTNLLSLNKIDWDFESFNNEGLNSFHWYPATYISAIPGSLIPILSKKDDIVMDTFCGTSVTGMEAVRLGRKFIGVDNNPIAIMISKSKLLFPNTKELRRIFENQFQMEEVTAQHPNYETLKKWYHFNTYQELNFLLLKIANIEDKSLRIAAQAVFSSILKKTSSQSRHWGWVCDNVIPKSNEIVYKSALDEFRKALNNFCLSVDTALLEIRLRNDDVSITELNDRIDIECGDSVKRLKRLEDKSIDLIHTSPPYYGVVDYVKAQRLSFLWFSKDILKIEDYSFEDFDRLRKSETGTRSTRHSKSSFINYIAYMSEYLSECYRVLKDGGHLVLIIGDSSSRNETILILHNHAINCGFKEEFDFERQIKQTRRRLMAKVANEQIKIYSK